MLKYTLIHKPHIITYTCIILHYIHVTYTYMWDVYICAIGRCSFNMTMDCYEKGTLDNLNVFLGF